MVGEPVMVRVPQFEKPCASYYTVFIICDNVTRNRGPPVLCILWL